MSSLPETYCFAPTAHVPNSTFPVLIYREVLSPSDATALKFRDALEKNHWKQGGVFKTFKAHHFHSVTHECYAVFSGSSRLLLGRGPLDDPDAGKEVDLRAGDMIVLPSGVAHCSLSSDGDYEYLGLYPEVSPLFRLYWPTRSNEVSQGSPKWDNNFCKADASETEEKAKKAGAVPVPQFDPVYGEDGPLVQIWSRTATARA